MCSAKLTNRLASISALGHVWTVPPSLCQRRRLRPCRLAAVHPADRLPSRRGRTASGPEPLGSCPALTGLDPSSGKANQILVHGLERIPGNKALGQG